MKKIKSRQENVKFIFCPSPFTIDKSEEWGEGNLQQFPNGGFLKINDDGKVSHGVQPNEGGTAPLGWEVQENGLFRKKPIWLSPEVHTEGVISMETADGQIDYEVKEPSMVTYNDLNGEPNRNDGWVQTVANLEKNYCL